MSLLVVVATAAAQATAVDYGAQIKPLLKARCYACHGSLKQEGGLRLDTAALLIAGGDSGSAVSLEHVNDSLILERVAATDPDQRMPPPHEGEPLTAEQIGRLRGWIAAGAPAPADESPEADPSAHWSFQPIVRPPVPRLDSGSANHPIDAFIAQQHRLRGLQPQPSAPRLALLRRLAIDLTGLPPSLEELEAFRDDDRGDWYRRAVEQWLADPRHGERWGRHWMDVWRYSDWWGLGEQLRFSQKHIWHWRDWIIESLNDDTPYDEMIRLMLAADELHPVDPDKLAATGYLARNFTLFNRPQWMDETVEHVSKGLLGLTMNCARCHDHKYDPIEQTDYYRMRAFFEPYHVRLDVLPDQADLNVDGLPRVFDALPDEPTYLYHRGDETQPDRSTVIAPGVPRLAAFPPLSISAVELPVAAWQPARQPWVLETHIAAAEARLAAAKDKSLAAAELAAVRARAAAMRVSWSDEPTAAVGAARGAAIAAERDVAVARAGQAVAQAEQALAEADDQGRPAAAQRLQDAQTALAEAQRQAAAEIQPSDTYQPLIGARWTPTRFGFSGQDDPELKFPPTSTGRRSALARWITDPRHPLTARVAVNHIWMRHMGAPLVPTVFDFGRNGKPPALPELLDWLAAEFIESGWSMKHLHRLIVTSEAYRRGSSLRGAEQNLALDPDNLYWWRRTPGRMESQVIRDSLIALAGRLDNQFGGPPVPPDGQSDSLRRSLYFFHSNNDRNQFLTVFDEALVTECYRREQSVVPQQALALANSGLAHDAAADVARRLATDDDAGLIRRAWMLVLGIDPNPQELAASQQALDHWRASGRPAQAPAHLVWALFNHNDFVTIR